MPARPAAVPSPRRIAARGGSPFTGAHSDCLHIFASCMPDMQTLAYEPRSPSVLSLSFARLR
jgi:hypothetical protein